MRYLKIGFGWLLLLALTACAHKAPDKTRFAQYAQTLPPINVPPGIKDPTGESYYPVPPVPLTAPFGTPPPLEPPGSQLTVQKQIKLPAPQ